MRVLLYQLDAMSRKLALGVLGDKQGDAVFAVSRHEALETIKHGHISVVLADTQKDGLEFIRAIRTEERESRSRLPVVALTIADTPSNRRRCTEAGADAVLPIPARAVEMLAAMESVGAWRSGLPSSASPATSTTPVLDIASALERVEGDRALLEELLRLFIEECHASLRGIRDAWAQRDARAMGRLAHTLKGSAANLGAGAVSEAAFALERLARSAQLEDAVQHMARLEREVENLAPEIGFFLEEKPADR